MVKIINNGFHNWERQTEMIQDEKGSFYKVKCSYCTMEAEERESFVIETSCHNPKSKRIYCNFRPTEIKHIKIINSAVEDFGIKDGDIYEVVPAPSSVRKKYKEALWIFSTEKERAIPLLPHEYKII